MKKGKRYSIRIDTSKKGDVSRAVEKHLLKMIVGQPRAVDHVTRAITSLDGGLRDPSRPIGVMIFAGPSGCGKSYTAKILAQILLGSGENFLYPLTIIQCSNLAESHRISTLIGSPPGYVDSHKIPLLHRFNIGKYCLMAHLELDIDSCKDRKLKQEKIRALQQVKDCIQSLQVGRVWVNYKKERLNAYHLLNSFFDKISPLSVILFDEIEKAHPDVWNLLLGIIEDGQLQLASNNEVTDFTNSLIILTTNTGSREMQRAIGINKIGLTPVREEDPKKLDQAVYNEAKKALEKLFPPELMGRLGKEIIAFRALKKEDYGRIFCQMMDELSWRLSSQNISIKYTSDFRNFVVEKGIDQKYGARILRDAVKKYVEIPASSAFSSGEIKKGDKVLFSIEEGSVVLKRQPRPKKKRIKKETKNVGEKKQINVGEEESRNFFTNKKPK